MRITGNALLLGSPDVRAELDSVIARNLGPVIDPLKLVFRLFQWAIAGVDSKRITKIEATVTIDIKGRQSAGQISSPRGKRLHDVP